MPACGVPSCRGTCGTCKRAKLIKDGQDCTLSDTPWWAIVLWVLAFFILLGGIVALLVYIIPMSKTIDDLEHKLHEIHEKLDYGCGYHAVRDVAVGATASSAKFIKKQVPVVDNAVPGAGRNI